MRIALVVERFVGSGGGVEEAARQIAAGLARAGESVHVLCRESGPAPTPGVEVERLPVTALWQPWRVTAFARRVQARVAQGDFEVVHALARVPGQDLYRAGAGSHAAFMTRTYGPVGAGLRRMSPRHLVQLRADARLLADPRQWIQCPSQRVRDDLMRGGRVAPDRLHVLSNGVDVARFNPGPDPAAAAIRAEHARPGDILWLFAGSGARRKGLDVALASIAGTPEARLLVAGRDPVEPGRRRARALGVADRVTFLGPRNDMPSVYRAADAFILPTRYDPFSNACLEAAASGLPVVSSDANGAMEVIGDGGRTISLEKSGVAGFAEAVRALCDAGLRREIGSRARKVALENDWDAHVARLLRLYERVIAAREAGGARTP